MLTILVASLKRPIWAPGGGVHTEPVLVEAEHFPEGSRERDLFSILENTLGEKIGLWVLFPARWAGKKPKQEDVEERLTNFLTMYYDRALVVGGSAACNFFGPKIYSTYIGTGCPDYGPIIYPAPHPEDLINSDNVCVGDLFLALAKCQKKNRE